MLRPEDIATLKGLLEHGHLSAELLERYGTSSMMGNIVHNYLRVPKDEGEDSQDEAAEPEGRTLRGKITSLAFTPDGQSLRFADKSSNTSA